MNAHIKFRDGDTFFTQIDEAQTPETLAQRMIDGGFVICRDERWGEKRTLIVNLADVKVIVLEPGL